jgi:hypothetical protein
MSTEATYLQKLETAQAELAAAEETLTTARANLAIAWAARQAVTPATPDKELAQRIKDHDLATERANAAQRARDTAKQAVVNLASDLRHAANYETEAEADRLVDEMRPLVRKARALRLEADRIDREEIGEKWDKYIVLAGIDGQTVDHRTEAPENRPRDSFDLYVSTIRLDGEHVPTLFEMTPLGQLNATIERLHAGYVAQDLAHQPDAPRSLTAEDRDKLLFVAMHRGLQAPSDLLAEIPYYQLLEVAGAPVLDQPLDVVLLRVPLTFELEAKLVAGIDRALALCAGDGHEYTPGAAAAMKQQSDWNEAAALPPRPVRENPNFVYGETE